MTHPFNEKQEKFFCENFDLFATHGWTVPPTITEEILSHIKSHINTRQNELLEELGREILGMFENYDSVTLPKILSIIQSYKIK